MPDIANERTEGLYDRKANLKKRTFVPMGPIITAPVGVPMVAANTIDVSKTEFSEEEKRICKVELNRLRRVLDDAKQARDTYKLMPDADPSNIDKLESVVTAARKNFRDYELVKNKVWGIIIK
jgi:predicted phosphohydrolase